MPADDGRTLGNGSQSDSGQHSSRPELCITLLGRFQVAVGDRIIEDRAWRRRKAASLVKLLALAPRHRLHREEILEYLWPGQDPETAGANLRVVLHAARRALQSGDAQGQTFLLAIGDGIVLQPDGEARVDVEAFERAAADARRSGDFASYRVALDRYTGELLPDDRYEDWTVGRRERLHDSYLALLTGFAEILEHGDDLPASIAALERVVATDPTHELAASRLMDAYARTGQRHRALRLFQQLRDALENELDASPDDETRRLYGEILASRGDWRAGGGGQKTPQSAPASNIRAPLTSFIGRQEQLAQARRALTQSRLVTLTGAGGCGKTRLALAVAGTVADALPDGTWFVDLSPIASGDAIARSIAGALQLRLDPALDELAALIAALGSRHMLVVLDNCEHLLEACAHLTEQLLQHCPELRILATSREALHIPGETVLRVPPLELPPETGWSVAKIGASEAIQLFCDRARYVQPDITLNPENAAVIAGICRRLDGLPLAIELAAARVSILSLRQLADRLSDPLGVLATAGRTREPRQQTLRATLDWSFDLLDSAERRLLARLSVFAGGWGLEAAEEVCSGAEVERRDVLALLAQLVDKSLVEARVQGDEARYRLLETVRQYAAERREPVDLEGALERRHASFYLNLAEEAEPGLLGGEQERWLEQLEIDLDNLRAALRWLEQVGEVESQLRIAAALVRMWWIRGYVNEGRHWLGSGLASAPESAGIDPGVRAKALQAAGNLARMQGDANRALEYLEECLTLRRQYGGPPELAHALNYLAAVLGVRGELPRAMELADESLTLFRQLGDSRGCLLALGTLGELTYASGQARRSASYFEEALPLIREIGDTHSLAIALNNLGEALRAQGLLDGASTRFGESLELFRDLGATHGVAYLLANLGDIERSRHKPEQALQHLLEALDLFHELGYRDALLSVIGSLAALEADFGQADRATRLFGAENALREDTGIMLAPDVSAAYDQAIATARASLPASEFHTAWEAGHEMTLDEAIALAGSVKLPQASSGADHPAAIERILTPRELDVARLAARDMTNRQIAETLDLSVRTVDTHIGNILRKLGIASRQEIATWTPNQAERTS